MREGGRETETEAERKESALDQGEASRCTAEAFWKWMRGPSAAYRLEGEKELMAPLNKDQSSA